MTANSHLANSTSGFDVPIDYATISDSGAENKAAVQALIDAIATESNTIDEVQGNMRMGMFPETRDELYAHLVALKAAIVDVV